RRSKIHSNIPPPRALPQPKSLATHPLFFMRWVLDMKHFFLACLFPMLLTAQSMQLTKQLGKTVLYGDIALSPDGTHLAWVQSTAATTSQQTCVRDTSGNAPATMVNIGGASDRTDSDPAWSPD